ncbi:Glia maturation factor beta-like [Homarus americanus]|uniref:Glia maturation factor beta-like n=1 Tax=Homarus americanus TaxID=6706 RepID=A0A8J5JVL1_HOMAM|nr:Glia maturation factor beta-like [Homarus americanus]
MWMTCGTPSQTRSLGTSLSPGASSIKTVGCRTPWPSSSLHPEAYNVPLMFHHVSDCQPQLQMMYAGSYNYMIKECDLTKVFQIRDLEELDEEWIQTNLKK